VCVCARAHARVPFIIIIIIIIIIKPIPTRSLENPSWALNNDSLATVIKAKANDIIHKDTML